MDQAGGVGRGQPLGHLEGHAGGLARAQPPRPPDRLGQRGTGQVFHHDVGKSVGRIDHGVNLDHVIVPDLGRGARLADEPNPVASVSQGRTEDLQSHHPVQHVVAPLEDDPHSPVAQKLEHAIGAQRAEVSFMAGRPEKLERGRLGRASLGEVPFRAHLRADLEQSGEPRTVAHVDVGRRDLPGPLPELGFVGEPVQRFPATVALLEVSIQLPAGIRERFAR